MKFCGVCTLFKDVRVYARPSMGMPGSETTLQQVMSLVVGYLVAVGVMVKVADDLFVGGETPEQLHTHVVRSQLRLIPCQDYNHPFNSNFPRLGLVQWRLVCKSAPHSHLVVMCISIHCKTNAVARRNSSEKLEHTEALQDSFIKAQKFLSSNKTITIPKPADQLWVVTNGTRILFTSAIA